MRPNHSSMRFIGAVMSISMVAAAFMAPPAARATLDGPVLYAHRGGAAEAPENTLGAFRQSVQRYGTEVWLEMDAQLSADGVLVVIHDDTLDRTTDCTGPVIETTASQLESCNAAHPEGRFPDWAFEPVPTLADVLEEGMAEGWKLQIELKNIPGEANFDPLGQASAEALVELLADSQYDPEHVQVQSFWPPTLDAVRQAAEAIGLERLELVFLTTSTLPGAPTGVGFLTAENVAFSAVRDYEIAAPDHRSLDAGPAAVQAAHLAGRRLVHWTVDDPGRIAELASWGVDGIITNAPGVARDALSR